jgi:hypothetical protein
MVVSSEFDRDIRSEASQTPGEDISIRVSDGLALRKSIAVDLEANFWWESQEREWFC